MLHLFSENECNVQLFLEIITDFGCINDYECPPNRACKNKKCVNPCSESNSCGTLANCIPQNHRAVCVCPPGYTGDAYRNCIQSELAQLLTFVIVSFNLTLWNLIIVVKTGECHYDSDCADHEICIEEQCKNPCQYPFDPCGQNAECTASAHRAICHCPPEWAGNPHVECYKCMYFWHNLILSN